MVLVRPEDSLGSEGENGCNTTIKVRTPKRILHFSDGILEEYSTDDEADATPSTDDDKLVDPSTMTWGPWLWYTTWKAGTGTVAVMDTVGEYLASFFGITTPKYYFELEEHRRRQNEIQADADAKIGWSKPSESTSAESIQFHVATNQPSTVPV